MNLDFVERSQSAIKVAIIALIPMGVILDLLVWRWRHLANYLIYFELINMLIQALVPLNYGDFRNLVHIMVMALSWFGASCYVGLAGIIGYTITSLIILFGLMPLVYHEDWSFGVVLGKVFTVFALFLGITVMSMLVLYIA